MKSNKTWIIIIGVLGVACLCTCILAAAAGGFLIIRERQTTDNNVPPTPQVRRETVQPHSDPTDPQTDPLPPSTATPASPAAYETLKSLQMAIVPNNDPRELAERLEGKPAIPETVDGTAEYQPGDRKEFWVSNVDTNENFQITAVLRSVSDSAYFWIEDGVRYDEGDLRRLAQAFNDKIYPTNREFFGSEWNPGVDNDPRLYIVYASGLGDSLAGYFSSADSVHPLAHEYSNAHEMFLLNSDNVDLGEEFTYGVLAHEFQHMIHWYRDRNEESWLNEGMSELAAFLNGYDAGGFDYVFATDPDLQLNDWPNDPNATTPHYGSSFLFVTYFLDRFGEDATKALIAHPDNGMDSVDAVLAELDINDPLTGAPVRADNVFGDWAAANFLMDESVSDGRYTYQNYPDAPQVYETETLDLCDGYGETRVVNQYGADYINLSCGGDFTLTFEGATEVGVLPENAASGEYAFWSNKGDESDMTLSQTFDLTGVSGEVSMRFKMWYDLETDYDYLYLLASTDDGDSWQILDTPSCTTEDPSGNSYGCGYNGVTDGYVEEEVDLSQFAGQKVTLRFEYVTDAAVNGEGFLLDDVEIPQINYFSDFETDDGGWIGDGFVRIQNRLPQTFQLSLIRKGDTTTVETLTLNDEQTLVLPISLSSPDEEIILVVSGTTRFTRQEAEYSIALTQ